MGAVVLGVVVGVLALVAGRLLWQRQLDRVRIVREFRHDVSRLVVAIDAVGPGIVGKPGERRDEAWAATAIQVGVLIDQLVRSAKTLRQEQRTLVTGGLSDLHARWTAAISEVMHHGGTLPESEFAMISMDASRVADAFDDKGGTGSSEPGA